MGGYGLVCWGLCSDDLAMSWVFVDVSIICVDRRFDVSAGSCGFADDCLSWIGSVRRLVLGFGLGLD